MKRIIFLLSVVFFTVTCPSATEAKILSRQIHSRWESFVLNIAQGVSSRMTTQGVDDKEGTTLALDAYPNTCASPVLKIISCQDSFAGQDKQYTIKGSMRIDRQNIVNVEYEIDIKNSCMFITPRGRNFPSSNNFKSGNYVRFKLDFDNPVYKRYSLSGFTAAYQRMIKICHDVQAILNERNDADYFKETPQQIPPRNPPATRQKPQSDSDFFI
ncbi:MAG: hypothetical protein DELT_00770 [Desulfovibrio sp.]